jgi:CheY-like chemotaxis protein
VNDLLDVSRVVSGKLRLDVQLVTLPEVVAFAIDAIRPAAEAKEISIVTAVEELDVVVSGDAGRLQQVVWNLLSNAVRFTPVGGRIDVVIERVAEGVAIVVRDSGTGVPHEFLPHAFERFRQAVSGTTRAHGGLGLGLAIVRHLVELHGGTVTVENNSPEAGATFRVVLPARPATRAVPDRPRLPDPLKATGRVPAGLDGLGILVADDDINAREMLAAVLENAGADVRSASSAEDALMMLETWAADVLLSDIEMPGDDGYLLMGRVRAQSPGRKRMTAIALTAHARPEDRLRALDAGFQWHLAKPIDPAELITVIATLSAAATALDPTV